MKPNQSVNQVLVGAGFLVGLCLLLGIGQVVYPIVISALSTQEVAK